PVEDLSSLSYVLREPQSSIRYTMNEALERIGIVRLNIPLEVGSTETIIEILARGKHVSFLPRFVVEERVRQGSLLRIKVKGFRIMRTLWIARNRSNIDHPVVDAFIAMLREEKARQEKQGSSSKP
ncbi:MAG: LysR substrate-binding domain-containing protein, partial [Gammaproteobacteria bacterium]|nr:LysR substrate-binding domain-containing protein [Gammaproteobacteria bacterium]